MTFLPRHTRELARQGRRGRGSVEISIRTDHDPLRRLPPPCPPPYDGGGVSLGALPPWQHGPGLAGCFDRPWYEENPQQKAFLDGLQALAKPALASNNPLRLEEAVKQSLALAAQTGAFTDWQGILRTIEGNAQKMAITDRDRPASFALRVQRLDARPWRAPWPSCSPHDRAKVAPPGLSEPAVAALKTFRLGERVTLSGRMGEIAGSGLFDLSTLFGKSDADNRQFLQVPRFVARIDALAAAKKK